MLFRSALRELVAAEHQCEARAAGIGLLELALERAAASMHLHRHAGRTQRIQRALEVWHVSGQPLSAFHARSRQSGDAAKAGDAIGRSLRLISLERNPGIDPAQFRFTPPKGADVIGDTPKPAAK